MSSKKSDFGFNKKLKKRGFWAGLSLESGAQKTSRRIKVPELCGYFHKDYFKLNVVHLVLSSSEHTRICSL